MFNRLVTPLDYLSGLIIADTLSSLWPYVVNIILSEMRILETIKEHFSLK